jgi:serine beta-lactamase-like protein LACTB, mitochondrial
MTPITTIRAACGSALVLLAFTLLCNAQAPSRSTIHPTADYSRPISAAHRIVLTAYERGLPAPTDAPFRGERVRPPALSVAIAVGGQVVYAEALGYADLEQRVRATTATKFRVGSISKPFTAAALGLLYQHGKIDLDAPVQRYVPSFRDMAGAATVREVGGHLGGIRGYKPNEPEGQTHYPSVDSSLSRFRDDSLVAQPGTKFVYSSYGFVLLSSVIEHAAGIPYLDFMRDSVFRVLHMANTVPDDPLAIIPRRARWYDLQPDGTYRNSEFADLSYKWAGGGFLSTPIDLVRFGIAMLHPGFLSDATLHVLETSQATAAGRPTQYGIGWFVSDSTRFIKQRTIRHSGGAVGSTANLLLYPDYDIVIAWAQNDGQLNDNDLFALVDPFIRDEAARKR